MMAESKIALLELLRNAGVDQPEFLREGLEQFLQAVIVSGLSGVAQAQRTGLGLGDPGDPHARGDHAQVGWACPRA